MRTKEVMYSPDVLGRYYFRPKDQKRVTLIEVMATALFHARLDLEAEKDLIRELEKEIKEVTYVH